jgi:plasmid stabilization system protein ParE
MVLAALMQVRWPRSRGFIEHLRMDRTGQPEAAGRVARTIYDQCARLKDFPNLGRASRRMAGRRELTFAPLPSGVLTQPRYHENETLMLF